MSYALKIAALTAFALVAAGSVAQANSHHGQQGSPKGSSAQHHPHHSSGNSSHSHPSGSQKVAIAHCDPGPCKGSHHPGKDSNLGGHHHKPPFWHHHHHRHSPEYRYAYGYKPYGYRDYSYERPQPSYATYTPPAAAPASPASCLTKEYLTDGPVVFKDTCTKEWAMGEAARTRFVNPGCIRKEYVEGNKVKFTDVCTKEWAMNPPPNQQATTAPTGPQAAAPEEDDED